MNTLTNYLEKFGSNFLVAAMVPSLGLVISCLVVFDPILRVSEAFQIDNGIYSLLGISLLVTVPTIIVGFTLTAMNTLILKLFEGYVFFDRFSFMKDAQERKADKLMNQGKKLREDIELLEKKRKRSLEEEVKLDILKASYYNVIAAYDQRFPPRNIKFMPTEFGNILKASEAYSSTRYGIDSVQLWPRLWHVIPVSYKQAIDDARNELSFLVNMSTLCIVFYMLCLVAIFVNAPSVGYLDAIVIFENGFRYILAGLVALLFNRFFNKAALYSVGDFGAMIRSAYDLFRLDLLEQFRLKHPKNSVEEFQTWQNLGELIVLGQESMDFTPLKYEVKRQKK